MRQQGSRSSLDIAAIATCALIWGTTWHAIKLQLGVVDPVVSVIYRFTLASALLFLWCLLRRERVLLSASQHAAALGVGVCIFAIDYACGYEAETRVASAGVAIMFGATALLNLTAFRLLHGQRAPVGAWVAASLGACGVLLLSWGELLRAGFDARTFQGLGLPLIGVIGTVGGNLFALRGERAAAPLAASTGWSMVYGAAVLALYCLLSGRRWALDTRPDYLGSLLYLAVLGSVVAFLLYFGIGRRRGYTMASYISAITPLIAMFMSSLFEGKSWAPTAFAGVTLVVLGQWLLLRAGKGTHEPSALTTEAAALAQREV